MVLGFVSSPSSKDVNQIGKYPKLYNNVKKSKNESSWLSNLYNRSSVKLSVSDP